MSTDLLITVSRPCRRCGTSAEPDAALCSECARAGDSTASSASQSGALQSARYLDVPVHFPYRDIESLHALPQQGLVACWDRGSDGVPARVVALKDSDGLVLTEANLREVTGHATSEEALEEAYQRSRQAFAHASLLDATAQLARGEHAALERALCEVSVSLGQIERLLVTIERSSTSPQSSTPRCLFFEGSSSTRATT